MPTSENYKLQFKNRHYQHDIPYVIFADFEAVLKPISAATPNLRNSFTIKTQEHVPCGYAYIVIGPDGVSEKPILHSIFMESLTTQHAINRCLKMFFIIRQIDRHDGAKIFGDRILLLHDSPQEPVNGVFTQHQAATNLACYRGEATPY